MRMCVRLGTLAAVALAVLVTGPEANASPGTTARVSVGTAGAQGTGDSLSPAMNDDGRYIAFVSFAPNLVPADTDACGEPPNTYNCPDIFVRDRELVGLTQRVNVSSGGVEANGESWNPSISADGRYVAFQSLASNLVSGDTYLCYDPFGNPYNCPDVFVRDRQAGTTERVSLATGGGQGNGESGASLAISADGRYVAFQSFATNLVSGDTNNFCQTDLDPELENCDDVFVRDRQAGTTTRVSVATAGTQGNGGSGGWLSISGDGRYVAFYSTATNLVDGDANAFCDMDGDTEYDDNCPDVFVRDRQAGTTTRVSVSSAGGEGDGVSYALAISADGQYVAFESYATNLVDADTNAAGDVFVRDRQAGTTTRVSVDSAGNQGNAGSFDPAVSADGQYVAFESYATNLVDGDTNAAGDVFVRERQAETTTRVSLHSAGFQGNAASSNSAVSGDGRFTAFESLASNLVLRDTNGASDVFLHDRITSSVGGVAKLPDVADGSVRREIDHTLLVGLLAAALALLAVGAWYAGKRFRQG